MRPEFGPDELLTSFCSVCRLVFSVLSLQCFKIQTWRPNRLDQTVHLWTRTTCLLMISFDSTVPSRYYETMNVRARSFRWHEKVLSLRHCFFFFFTNHGSDMSFWSTFKTINAQIRSVIYVKHSFGILFLLISGKITNNHDHILLMMVSVMG